MQQLERTGLLDRIGRENVFLVHQQWGVSAYQAYEAAQTWLESVKVQDNQKEDSIDN
jgi:hypothetical protein